jgi:hypothetical protein
MKTMYTPAMTNAKAQIPIIRGRDTLISLIIAWNPSKFNLSENELNPSLADYSLASALVGMNGKQNLPNTGLVLY